MSENLTDVLETGSPVAPASPPDPRLVSNSFLGVELEFEGVNPERIPLLPYWVGKGDGSLRDGGWEWIFQRPLQGAMATAALTSMFDEARRSKYKISIRTGMHYHVNFLDTTLAVYKANILLYALVEPMIYQWIGDMRDENIHCLPWYSTSDAVLAVSKLYNGTAGNFTAYLRQIERYSGLNLHATGRFGTMEYRHMETCKDLDRTLLWINVGLALKQAAGSLVQHGVNIQQEVEQGPAAFIEKVLPRPLFTPFYAEDAVRRACTTGVDTVLDIMWRARPKFAAAADWDAATRTQAKTPHTGFLKFMESRPKPQPPEPIPGPVPEPELGELAGGELIVYAAPVVNVMDWIAHVRVGGDMPGAARIDLHSREWAARDHGWSQIVTRPSEAALNARLLTRYKAEYERRLRAARNEADRLIDIDDEVNDLGNEA